jgi:predicted DNA-binding transcriptional regulator AlpA
MNRPRPFDEILRWPEVQRVVKLCRGTVRKLERSGRFPPRQALTDYSVGWRKSEVAAWIAGRRDWSAARSA